MNPDEPDKLKQTVDAAYETSWLNSLERTTPRQPLTDAETTILNDLLKPYEYDVLTLVANIPSKQTVVGVATTTLYEKTLNQATFYDQTTDDLYNTTRHPGLDKHATKRLDQLDDELHRIRNNDHYGRHVVNVASDQHILAYTTKINHVELDDIPTWHE